MKSTDFNTKDAPEKIAEMTTEEEILAFIDGDERKTVTDAAQKKIAELRGPKQGEDGPITKKTSDFKAGVEGTKDVNRDSDPLSVTDTENGHGKRVVTCEDVLESMRKKGRQI